MTTERPVMEIVGEAMEIARRGADGGSRHLAPFPFLSIGFLHKPPQEATTRSDH